MSSKRVSLTDIDGYVRDELFDTQESCSGSYSHSARLVREALYDSTTPKQRTYIIMYFKKRMNMEEIASLCGVSKSTVSRTISRGRSNILKAMRSSKLKKLLEHIDLK